jgi:WD40 repeat protein
MKPNLLRCIFVLGLLGAVTIRSYADVLSQPKRLFGLGSLNVAAVSNDKRHLATAGESAAYLWDFETGIVRHRLPDHKVMVSALAFSPDSTRLVTGARFGSIAIWSTETGARLKIFAAHATDVNSITFSADGKRFVSASADNSAAIWSVETGELLGRVKVQGFPMNVAVFTPDGTQLVTANSSQTNNVRVWDIESGSEVRILGQHEGEVLSLAFLSDGTLATGGMDQKVRLWNLATGEVIKTLDAARGGVRHLVPIPGTKLLAAGSDDQKVNVYDWSTGNALHSWSTEPLNSLGLVPGTDTLVTSTTDLLVRVVDLFSGLTQRALTGHTTSTAGDVAFSPDGKYVLSAGVEKATRLWNRTNATLVGVFEGSSAGSASAAFSADGKRVLTTTSFPRKSALMWNTETGQLERELVGHTDWLLAATFSPDGSRVATSSLDRTVRVWNAANGQQVRSFSAAGNFMYAVAFSPDGKLVAGGGSSFDPTVHIWDIETGFTQATISEDAGSVRSILFTPSGAEIIIGWDEGLIRVVNLATGKVSRELFPAGFLSDMALSPDGELLVVAEGWPSFAARIFDLRSGQQLRVLTGHTTPVGAVAFNARGTQIVTGADVVRLWDVADLAARIRTDLKPGGFELAWNIGVLQQATAPDGEWSTVPNAVSPFTLPIDAPSRFFRVETQVED